MLCTMQRKNKKMNMRWAQNTASSPRVERKQDMPRAPPSSQYAKKRKLAAQVTGLRHHAAEHMLENWDLRVRKNEHGISPGMRQWKMRLMRYDDDE